MSYAVIAQAISLLVSVFMSFFVSKFMTVGGFGYYQLFLFYSTYVGLFQFGISEGVYLENGGKTYESLHYPELKQLFINSLITEAILLVIFCGGFFALTDDIGKKYIVLFIAAYAVAYLLVMYFGMLLQSVNKTERYSRSIIIGKLFTLVLFIALVAIKNYDYIWYCVIYLIGYILSGAIVAIDCKEIIAAKIKPAFVLLQRKKTIIAGSSLLLSGLISSFLIGVNRIYIEQFLGIEVFAKVSIALSLCNFVILFAIQVGMVMFPNVVLLNKEDKTSLYRRLNEYTCLLAPCVFVGYIPLKIILGMWIPQYTESIRWMLLFIPYMVYEIKTQIMYNTYLKALRKERTLFRVNLAALIVCAIVNFVVIKHFQQLEAAFWVIDIIMIVKSMILSRIIENEYGINLVFRMCLEAVFCCASAWIVYMSAGLINVGIVLVLYAVYFVITGKVSKG